MLPSTHSCPTYSRNNKSWDISCLSCSDRVGLQARSPNCRRRLKVIILLKCSPQMKRLINFTWMLVGILQTLATGCGTSLCGRGDYLHLPLTSTFISLERGGCGTGHFSKFLYEALNITVRKGGSNSSADWLIKDEKAVGFLGLLFAEL